MHSEHELKNYIIFSKYFLACSITVYYIAYNTYIVFNIAA